MFSLRLSHTLPRLLDLDLLLIGTLAIHAVDKIHTGNSDSSVMYIPVCPTTEHNLRYLADQRDTFERGVPAPDFPGGNGESEHVGRPDISYLREYASEVGLKALGF